MAPTIHHSEREKLITPFRTGENQQTGLISNSFANIYGTQQIADILNLDPFGRTPEPDLLQRSLLKKQKIFIIMGV